VSRDKGTNQRQRLGTLRLLIEELRGAGVQVISVDQLEEAVTKMEARRV